MSHFYGPTCGFWREKKETGIHMDFPDNGPGVPHELVATTYAR